MGQWPGVSAHGSVGTSSPPLDLQTQCKLPGGCSGKLGSTPMLLLSCIVWTAASPAGSNANRPTAISIFQKLVEILYLLRANPYPLSHFGDHFSFMEISLVLIQWFFGGRRGKRASSACHLCTNHLHTPHLCTHHT